MSVFKIIFLVASAMVLTSWAFPNSRSIWNTNEEANLEKQMMDYLIQVLPEHTSIQKRNAQNSKSTTKNNEDDNSETEPKTKKSVLLSHFAIPTHKYAKATVQKNNNDSDQKDITSSKSSDHSQKNIEKSDDEEKFKKSSSYNSYYKAMQNREEKDETSEEEEEGPIHPAYIVLHSESKSKPDTYYSSKYSSNKKSSSDFSLFIPVINNEDNERVISSVDISEILVDRNGKPYHFDFQNLNRVLEGYVTKLDTPSSNILINRLSDLVLEGSDEDGSSSSSEEDDDDFGEDENEEKGENAIQKKKSNGIDFSTLYNSHKAKASKETRTGSESNAYSHFTIPSRSNRKHNWANHSEAAAKGSDKKESSDKESKQITNNDSFNTEKKLQKTLTRKSESSIKSVSKTLMQGDNSQKSERDSKPVVSKSTSNSKSSKNEKKSHFTNTHPFFSIRKPTTSKSAISITKSSTQTSKKTKISSHNNIKIVSITDKPRIAKPTSSRPNSSKLTSSDSKSIQQHKSQSKISPKPVIPEINFTSKIIAQESKTTSPTSPLLPSTARPTTAKPTTASPTTVKSTTESSTTAKPTTARSTTAKPATARSTTAKPTTRSTTPIIASPKVQVIEEKTTSPTPTVATNDKVGFQSNAHNTTPNPIFQNVQHVKLPNLVFSSGGIGLSSLRLGQPVQIPGLVL